MLLYSIKTVVSHLKHLFEIGTIKNKIDDISRVITGHQIKKKNTQRGSGHVSIDTDCNQQVNTEMTEFSNNPRTFDESGMMVT